MATGREKTELRLELPVDAHIPHDYVGVERLRLEAYPQKLSTAVDSERDGIVVLDELTDRYGAPPLQVPNLMAVSRLRRAAGRRSRRSRTSWRSGGDPLRVAPAELPDSLQVRLQRLYPKTVLKPTVRTMLIPLSKTRRGGQPPRDTPPVVIRSVLADLAVGVL